MHRYWMFCCGWSGIITSLIYGFSTTGQPWILYTCHQG